MGWFIKWLSAVVCFSAVGLFSCELNAALKESLRDLGKGDVIYDECVDRGIDLYFLEDFEEAVKIFDFVAQEYPSQCVSEVAYGSALWGLLFCHAALSHEDLVYSYMNLIHDFFIKTRSCCGRHISMQQLYGNQRVQILRSRNYQDGEWFDRNPGERAPDPEAKFADPNEKNVSVQDCIDRVNGTAKAIKYGICHIKNRQAIFILNEFIDNIARSCINCCVRGGIWTACVGPIVAKLQKWRIFGIPDDPAWD